MAVEVMVGVEVIGRSLARSIARSLGRSVASKIPPSVVHYLHVVVAFPAGEPLVQYLEMLVLQRACVISSPEY